MRCIDFNTNEIVKNFVGSTCPITTIETLEKKVFVGGYDGFIRSFDIETGEV